MKPLISFLFLLVFQFNNAQIIAAFSGTSTPSTSTVTDISATALSRGPGITLNDGTTFNSGNWTTNTVLDTNDYIEWTITAGASFSFSVTSISINYDRDDSFFGLFGIGPQQLVIRSSNDNYTTNIYTDTSVNANGETVIFSTTQNSSIGGSITFRLYAFDAATGFFGLNGGTFDIEGGLGTVLGLTDTGISMSGTVNYDGLYYDGTSWSPNAPNNTTGSDNAIIASGNYTLTSNAQVNDLEIRSTSILSVNKGDSIIINGDLTVNGNLELDSDSNEYSSLIVNGMVSGKVVYKRAVNNTAAVGEDDANDLISPPVSGEAFNIFLTNNSNVISNSSNTLYLFGPFNKTTGSYDTYSNTETAILDAGNGYRAASTNSGTFSFTGVVNTSTVAKTISNSGPAYKEWNLIGNPYPSFIKLSEFLNINNSQFASLNVGVYGYDGDNWTIWNQAYSDENPNALITPGQGFLVASKTGGGTVIFNPNMRSIGNSDDFILGRPSNISTSAHFELQITNNSKSYATDIYFNSNASRGLDIGYDANIFNDIAPAFSIYSHLVENNEDKAMAIQSLGSNDFTDISIPLGVNANQGEQLTFNISSSTLPSTIEIFLEDKTTNTMTLLNTNDYILTPSNNLVGTGRFFLNFRDITLSNTKNKLKTLNIYTNKADRTILISGQLSNNTVANIFDIQGRFILSKNLDVTSRLQTIKTHSLLPSIYVLQLSSIDQSRTEKIVLN